MMFYDDLLTETIKKLSLNSDISNAIELVIRMRKNQIRKVLINGHKIKIRNYAHEIWVANLVQHFSWQLSLSHEQTSILILAAILHDMYEDFELLLEDFNEEVRGLVFQLSKNHENYHGFSGMDSYAMLIKTADRVINLSTCFGVFSEEKLLKYLLETDEMINQFTNKNEFSDFCVGKLQIAKRELMEKINESNSCYK